MLKDSLYTSHSQGDTSKEERVRGEMWESLKHLSGGNLSASSLDFFVVFEFLDFLLFCDFWG